MKAYLDSSVVLRVVLGEPKRLRQWSRITTAVSSEIVRVECFRVLDRLRLSGAMGDRELARRRATTHALLSGLDLVRVNRAVVDRASEPFPTLLRTLDAVHVATALLVRPRYRALRFATHDEDLAAAALGMGLPVIGVD